MHLLLNLRKKLFLDFFQLAVFQFLLAGDAVAGPGHSFQAFGVDLISAVHALAKLAFSNPLQRSLNHRQKLAIVIALGKKKFLGIGACRAISNVLSRVLVSDAAVFFRAAHGFAQDLLTLFQSFFKAFQLLLVHVF